MKAYTDIKQSRKLAEILPLESADMHYLCGDKADIRLGGGVYEELEDWLSDGRPRPADIPCWSLAMLLEILDFPELSKDRLGEGKVGWMVSTFPDNCRYDSEWHDNPVDACYEMILNHELNLL